jgi:hypothetical protein
LYQSVSPIEAGIAYKETPKQGRDITYPVSAAANTNTSDFNWSSKDLALPLSRHVLKFVPPLPNQHRTTAKPPQQSTHEHAEQPAFYNQPDTAASCGENDLMQAASPVQDSLIRLAATVCFEDRQNCAAIINGKSVRAGQMIFGYTLVRIVPGKVLMQKNEKYFSLKMDRTN